MSLGPGFSGVGSSGFVLSYGKSPCSMVPQYLPFSFVSIKGRASKGLFATGTTSLLLKQVHDDTDLTQDQLWTLPSALHQAEGTIQHVNNIIFTDLAWR